VKKIKKSLLEARPDIAKEWHPTKNGKLILGNIPSQSNVEFWWICAKKHEWKAVPYNRVKGVGCPYCSGNKVCIDNSLETLNPALAKQWHPTKNGILTSNDVTCGSRKKVWWVCSEGHSYEASVANRSNKRGCPYCAGKKVCKDNCLTTLRFGIAKEWHPEKNGSLTPNDVTIYSGKRAWWECSKGHEWQTAIYNRIKGSGCPYCSGKKVCKDNSLATLNPSVAKEWHPTKNGRLIPSNITCVTGKKVWWQCSEGHEWRTSVASRTSGKTNCPFCSGRFPTLDRTLEVLKPGLMCEVHQTKNNDLVCGSLSINSNKKVWWKCSNGHEWKTTVAHRTEGTGCPICAKGSVSPISQRWLDSLNVPAENREVRLGELGFRVDGFDPETNTVYEFLGDLWHGNPNVYETSDKNPVNKKSFGELFDNTINRLNKIRAAGYKLEVIWEEDYK
jgi:hypothetical protein